MGGADSQTCITAQRAHRLEGGGGGAERHGTMLRALGARWGAAAAPVGGRLAVAGGAEAATARMPAAAAIMGRRTLAAAAAQAHTQTQNAGEGAGVESPQEFRKFTRANLLAEHYKDIFRQSSVVFFVAGDITSVIKPLRELGFGVTRAKASLVRVTARKLAPEDDLGFETAKQMAKGITNLVYLEDPLLSFVSSQEKLKAFTKMIPISRAKNDVYKNKFVIMGGFIHDEGKTNPNLWFTRPGVDAFVELLKTESKYVADAETLSPHQLFQAKVVAGMRNQLGAIRTPLLKPGQAAASTVRKIPENIAATLAKVRALRQDEADA